MNEVTYVKHLKTVIKLMQSLYGRDIVDYNFADNGNVELKNSIGITKAIISESILTNLWNEAERGDYE